MKNSLLANSAAFTVNFYIYWNVNACSNKLKLLQIGMFLKNNICVYGAVNVVGVTQLPDKNTLKKGLLL